MTDERGSAPKAREKRNKILRGVCAALLCIVLVGAGFGGGWAAYRSTLDARDRSILWAIDTAKKNFYTPIDEDAFYDKLFSAFELDPYSRYYTKEEYAAVQAESAGSHAGYGISVSEVAGAPIQFARVVENSPAQLAGVRRGMYLVGFGAEEGSIAQGGVQELNALISQVGTGGLWLRFGYERDGSDAQTAHVIPRAYRAAYCSYRDSGCSYAFRGTGEKLTLTETGEPLPAADEHTAYIRIDQFYGGAVQELEQLLACMKERGRENLILDLRSNGGGYLDVFLRIAALLVNETGHPALAAARYRDGRVEEYTAEAGKYGTFFSHGSRVLVLGDEHTASASECLIGALVDYGTVKAGDILLRENEAGVFKTYGKGIMQSHYTDDKGNVLKLTSAEILWPKGRSIHGKGVTEAEGAIGVPAPLIWGREDDMLQRACAMLSS